MCAHTLQNLRPQFFSGLEWYEGLSAPAGEPSAWWVAKDGDPNVWVDILNAALAFAIEHDLAEVYRRRFAGISPQDLHHERAQREGRTCSFPIWEIANELLVARYLERVFTWRFDQHEPPGRQDRKGDWQFVTPSGEVVFIEVKSIREPEITGGVFSANFTPKVRAVVARAYAQLPLDGRSVLVVLVGGGLTLDMPAGNPQLSWLFGALFGQFQIRFQVMPFDPSTVRGGPSFRDMTVHLDQASAYRLCGGAPPRRSGGTRIRVLRDSQPVCPPGGKAVTARLREGVSVRRGRGDSGQVGRRKPPPRLGQDATRALNIGSEVLHHESCTLTAKGLSPYVICRCVAPGVKSATGVVVSIVVSIHSGKV